MTKTYFGRADGVMLLYDVTSERSFTSVRQFILRTQLYLFLNFWQTFFIILWKRRITDVWPRHWVQCIDDVSEKRIPIILCGNKVDQRTLQQDNARRCVGAEDGEKMAREHR